MTQKPDIVTFGCRLNFYESEVMREHAEAAGLDRYPAPLAPRLAGDRQIGKVHGLISADI